MNKPHRIPLPISLLPHWQDHRFLGRAVLPAVEAMAILAATAQRFDPTLAVKCPAKGRFEKFLELPPNTDKLEAFCDLSRNEEGGITADLVTRQKSRSLFITRTNVHASLSFLPCCDESQDLPLSLDADLKGRPFFLSAAEVYDDLVPFGPAYHTLTGELRLSQYGILAALKTPAISPPAPFGLLGSPFTLDGAFHAACIWTQRYKKVVAFPISINQRVVLNPTQPDKTYHCRVIPTSIQNRIFFFDIWIFDRYGRLHEVALGVGMSDVSQGRMRPPQWIFSDPVPA